MHKPGYAKLRIAGLTPGPVRQLELRDRPTGVIDSRHRLGRALCRHPPQPLAVGERPARTPATDGRGTSLAQFASLCGANGRAFSRPNEPVELTPRSGTNSAALDQTFAAVELWAPDLHTSQPKAAGRERQEWRQQFHNATQKGGSVLQGATDSAPRAGGSDLRNNGASVGSVVNAQIEEAREREDPQAGEARDERCSPAEMWVRRRRSGPDHPPGPPVPYTASCRRQAWRTGPPNPSRRTIAWSRGSIPAARAGSSPR